MRWHVRLSGPAPPPFPRLSLRGSLDRPTGREGAAPRSVTIGPTPLSLLADRKKHVQEEVHDLVDRLPVLVHSLKCHPDILPVGDLVPDPMMLSTAFFRSSAM